MRCGKGKCNCINALSGTAMDSHTKLTLMPGFSLRDLLRPGTLYEGGVRVPAIVRWPGVVAPMTTVRALPSSLDWMPTFASLAGYKLELGVIYDGWDMSDLLFTAAGQRADLGRRDRYFYHSSDGAKPGAELVAVRYGPWKLHFVTKGWGCQADYPDKACCSNQPEGARIDVGASGGLLFNVERDMSEVLPISHSSAEFKRWAPVLNSMAAEYSQTYSPATVSQMGRGSSKDRFPCCSPGCTPLPDCCKCA